MAWNSSHVQNWSGWSGWFGRSGSAEAASSNRRPGTWQQINATDWSNWKDKHPQQAERSPQWEGSPAEPAGSAGDPVGTATGASDAQDASKSRKPKSIYNAAQKEWALSHNLSEGDFVRVPWPGAWSSVSRETLDILYDMAAARGCTLKFRVRAGKGRMIMGGSDRAVMQDLLNVCLDEARRVGDMSEAAGCWVVIYFSVFGFAPFYLLLHFIV
jgi:hypothetical protein